MRIVLLGDVHANMSALEAALREAEKAGHDRMYHTGGLVGHGGQPNEVVHAIASLGVEGVRGDPEELLVWEAGVRPSAGGIGRSTPQLTYTSRAFLMDLPFTIEFEAEGRRVMLFHGGPTDLFEPLDMATAESRLRGIAEEVPADVYLSGHSHRPSHRSFEGRHFINAGSVGLPQDGDPRGCVAVVDLGRTPQVQFIRFELDSRGVGSIIPPA